MIYLLTFLVVVLLFKVFNDSNRIEKLEEHLFPSKPSKHSTKTGDVKIAPLKPVEIAPIKIEKPRHKPKVASRQEFESQLVTQLPVWIGGIALALGGFYLVKYSIDAGLLSPAVRVMLAFILGLSLVLLGQKQNLTADSLTSRRISQSLTGAGLATLYGTLYAATSLYEFIPSVVGFGGMALTTGLAILLSLRQGPAIALLGLVGGFVTPAIIGSDSPSVINLFSYLFMLYAAVSILARHRKWLWMIPLASAASYLWVLLWFFVYASPADSIWLMLFVVATLGVSLSLSKPALKDGNLFLVGPMVYLGSCVAGLLTFFILSFDVALQVEQVILFGLLSAATFVLAYFNQAQYRLYPVLSFITAFAILATSGTVETSQYVTYFCGALMLFTGGASALYFRHDNVQWAGFIFASSMMFYVLGYIVFKTTYDLGLSDTLWSSIALAFALYGTYLVSFVYEKDKTDVFALAVFSAQATSFVSIAMAVLWAASQLHVFELGLLLQMVALIYIARWLNLRILISYAVGLAAFYLLLNFEMIASIASVLVLEILLLQKTFVDWTWSGVFLERTAYILPAVLFLVAGYKVARLQRAVSAIFNGIGWVLLYMGLIFTLSSFSAGSEGLVISYLYSAVVLNLTFAFGVMILYINNTKPQDGLYSVGLSFVCYGLYQLIYGHVLLGNPLWSHVVIQGLPLINTLWFVYALPVGWMYMTYRVLPQFKLPFTLICLALAFVFVTLQVRSFYQLPVMNESLLSNAEVYSYSLVWLISAAVALFFGLLRKNQILRYAGLLLMGVVAGKVFLFDAAELEGLYRVISFLGLGASLIGLSYVYARFVQDK